MGDASWTLAIFLGEEIMNKIVMIEAERCSQCDHFGVTLNCPLARKKVDPSDECHLIDGVQQHDVDMYVNHMKSKLEKRK